MIRQKYSYFVTTPLIHLRCWNTSGVIHSLVRNRRKYRLYTSDVTTVENEPKKNAESARWLGGIALILAFISLTNPLGGAERNVGAQVGQGMTGI
jgi:hypothetical protein